MEPVTSSNTGHAAYAEWLACVCVAGGGGGGGVLESSLVLIIPSHDVFISSLYKMKPT